MATKEEVTALQTTLEAISKYKTESLVSRTEWGAQDFKDIESSITQIINLANILLKHPIDHVPSADINGMKNYCDKIRLHLEEIDQFDVKVKDHHEHKAISRGLETNVNEFIRSYHSWITFTNFLNQDSLEELQKLKKIALAAEEQKEKSEKFLTDAHEQSEKILTDMRTASAQAGAGTFTKDFDDESKSIKKKSVWWLFSTTVLAFATVIVAVWFFFQSNSKLGDSIDLLLINLIVAKVSIVAVLLTATLWCGRIYKSLVHLSTVNRHRALSLLTFQAFANATEDTRVKDSVLMAATNCIFANVPTGLVDYKNAPSDQAVQFVEIGKSPQGDS